ncbi:hypothetical protein AB0L10_43685 [Streptomyces flaveolus]|uniref:hypothetical protein n=1 Tax=Streptomyces flaveolus TaxID=67297 RepID=UPI003421FCA6
MKSVGPEVASSSRSIDLGVNTTSGLLRSVSASTRYHVNGTADGRTVRIWHVALPVDPKRTAESVSSTAVSNVKVFALSGRA